MREIKFRAKVADSDNYSEKQVEMIGHFVHFTGFISTESGTGYVEQLEEIKGVGWLDVDLETVGQYTGLKDVNGREIYEGDVLKFKRNVRVGTRRSRIGRSRSFSSYAEYKEMDICGIVTSGEYGGFVCFYVDVEKSVPYEHYFFGSGKSSDKPSVAINNLSEMLKVKNDYEIIGNIYGNPELLDVTE